MRRPRLTTRRLMILVALVAVLLAAERVFRQSMHYLQKAEDHALRSDRWVRSYTYPEAPFTNCMGPHGRDKLLLANYHDQLKQKYEYAACHPWASLPPDPPPPWPRAWEEEEVPIQTLPVSATSLREMLEGRGSSAGSSRSL
jgi:hypothetical protein